MGFTDKQKLAIEDRGNDLLISASAGTGKTAVLIERVFSLIKNNKIDIDRMLIVTFTEAAADELKSRISARLKKALNDENSDIPFISSQLEKVNFANISTIHGFCKQVVSDNFSFLGLEPELKVSDDSIQLAMIKESLTEVLKKAYSEPEIPLAIKCFGDAYDSKSLSKEILSIYYSAASSSDPDKYLSNLLENTMKEFSENDFNDLKKNIVCKTFKKIKEIKNDMLNCLAISENIGISAYIDTSRADLEMLENIFKAEKEYDELKSKLYNIDFIRLKSPKKEEKAFLDEDLSEKYKKARNKYKASLLKFVRENYNLSYDLLKEEVNYSKQISASLIKLSKEFKEIYSKKKRNLGCIDFDDMQHFAYKVLSKSEIAETYKNNYDAVFVDEYQDTSRIQDDIISFIKKKGKLFIVGDYKQSIYSFRKAKPELFLQKYKEYYQNEKAKAIELNDNFRSMPYVLESVNIVFEKLMTESFGGIDYKEKAMLISGKFPNGTEELLLKPGYKNLFKTESLLCLIDKKAIKEQMKTLKNITEEELSYLSLIKRIKEITTEKYPVFDELGNIISYENYKLSQICILNRSPNRLAEWVKKIFDENGISLNIDIDEDLFELVEIATLIDFIKIISNPLDDIALLSVMRSPIGGFTDDELLLLSRFPRTCYFELLDFENLKKTEKLKNSTVDKLKSLKTKIKEFRENDGISIKNRLLHLIEISNYRYYIMGKRDSFTLYYALDDFISFIDSFEQNTGGGLYDLIRYIEELKDSSAKIKYSSKRRDESESVSLLSIHKSKGLQFPVVILFDSQKKFNPSHSDKIVFAENGSLLAKNVYREKALSYNNFLFQTEKQKNYDKQILEEMRLLYVAMTRPIYKLEVFATVDVSEVIENMKNSNVDEISFGKSYFDWISKSIGFKNIPSTEYDKIKNNVYELNKNWSVKILDVENLKEYVSLKKPLTDEKKQFVEIEYPKLISGRRKTVTQLKKEDNIKLDIDYASKKFFNPEDDETSFIKGTERGNAYHLFMKLFIDSGLELEEFIKENNEKNYISDKDMSIINIDDIKAFCKTILYKDIKKSKKIWTEKPFVYKKEIDKEKFYIQGIIDLAFIKDGKIIILDYKSDRIKDKKTIMDLYKIQLDFYAEAIENITDIEVGGKMIYSFTNRAVYEY